MINTLYIFIAEVTAPEKGLGKKIPYALPNVTVPHSLKLVYSLVKAHPGYVAAFLLAIAVGILVGMIIAVAKGREKRLRRLALFKPMAKIVPTDLGIENYLGQTGYIRREGDEAVAGLLEEGTTSVLVLGRTGSGKTCTVFEALKGKVDYHLLAPKPRPISLKELTIPGLSKKKIVLFLDDLYRYIKKLDAVGLVRQLETKAKGTLFLATCSPEKLPLLEKEAPELLRLFRPRNRISIRDLTPAEQKFLARALSRDETATMAGATPAALTLNLAEMKERYRNSGDARLIIHSLLLLNKAFIFIYSEPLTRKVCTQVFDKAFSNSQWKEALKGLVGKGLITINNGNLAIYEGYLEEDFVDYIHSEKDIDTLQDILLQARDWEGLFSIGVYRSTKGQWEKTLQALEMATHISPHFIEARYLLGQVYGRLGMADRALEAYKEVIRLDKSNTRAYYALGTIYNEMYMIKEAVESLKRAILLDPYHSRAYFQLAMAFEKAGMIEECLAGLREATRIDPDYTEARHYLAGLYQKRGQYGEALQEYKELVRINPDDEESHLTLATSYNKIGRINEAIKELRELIRINPANSKAHYTLALTYYKKGMLEEAIKEFKDVLILNPEDHIARSNLALAYSKRNLLDEAIGEYKEILRLKPQEVGTHYNLAHIYEKQGKREEAVAEYEEVIKLNPQHVEAHYRLALIYLKNGLLEEALKGFKEVIRLRPTHPMAHGQLAMIYQKAGLVAEARREYKLYEKLKTHQG